MKLLWKTCFLGQTKTVIFESRCDPLEGTAVTLAPASEHYYFCRLLPPVISPISQPFLFVFSFIITYIVISCFT